MGLRYLKRKTEEEKIKDGTIYKESGINRMRLETVKEKKELFKQSKKKTEKKKENEIDNRR